MKIDFDNFAEDYDAALATETRFFSRSDLYFAAYKVEIAHRLVTDSPSRILEFGCGTGRNLPFFRHFFPNSELHGFDPSVASVEIARARNPDANLWDEAGFRSLKARFDLIFVAGVFHHIDLGERIEVARQIRSLLSDGGEVIVFEHNPYNPVTRRIVDRCPYDAGAVLLRKAELRDLLTRAGFRVCASAYSLFFPPRFSVLAAVERSIGWLPVGGQYWIHARNL